MNMTERRMMVSEVPPDGTLERFFHSVEVCEEFGVDDFTCLLSEAKAAAEEISSMRKALESSARALWTIDRLSDDVVRARVHIELKNIREVLKKTEKV